ncbi:tryptophan 2,3-dioxygenase family protein [Porifericola rhodea]|uniref:tryptophan 2,3-dioxygenase family protein n=1 Tax=Porifericola rhodea TaxID=930972 RepID=UPI0026671BCA|nr:tryptophan 2,3-dioxygenase family protein [Porifericola rhodea]WKN32613.1 tryptophan 2,3-dioxygenase family protein [Porifericola rhodea]
MIDKITFSPEIMEKLEKLSDKFAKQGQSLSDYLDGLLHADYLSYWEYIELETLLTLQKPRTEHKDEMIFVTYHQITELYFKLILWELEQINAGEVKDAATFLDKIKRINRYFGQLTDSFTIMTEGLNREQFAQFRMSLLPSSGFQSVQYRLIEILSTDLINLVHADYVLWLSPDDPVEAYMDNLYWKAGARDMKTGKKTLTLRQFEEKYNEMMLRKAQQYKQHNLRKRMQKFVRSGDVDIIAELRAFDHWANVHWPLSHFRAAVRHLVSNNKVKDATGGTNWRKYLPPRFQRVVFFPELWSEEEKDNWGKSWVIKQLEN